MELYEIIAYGVLAFLALAIADQLGLPLGKLRQVFDYLRSTKK